MLEWLEGLAGPQYARPILWALAALALVVVVLLIVRLVRGMAAGTYVAGGRSRKTRLSVMDATAVDSHRRLVLVRRDDVEHLLLIGGPTDVVVERDIRLAAARRPVLTAEAPQQRPAQPAQPNPSAAQPAQPYPGAPHGPAAQHTTARPQAAQQAPAGREAPPKPPAPPRPAPPAVIPAAPRPAPPPVHDPLDEALMNELDFSLDDEAPAGKPAAGLPSLDEEMTRLLGELSVNKR